MKYILKFIFITSIFSSSLATAANITWDTAVTSVGVNDVFTIDVIGTGFASNVDGGGVNFSFDANVLNVTSISINGSVWDFGAGFNSTGAVNNVAGTVDGIYVNAWSAVTGDFSVASVTFQAIGSGASTLSLSEFALNPWASGGSLINPAYTDASVIVSAVPAPAAVWLFGSGLIGLIGISKRKTA